MPALRPHSILLSEQNLYGLIFSVCRNRGQSNQDRHSRLHEYIGRIFFFRSIISVHGSRLQTVQLHIGHGPVSVYFQIDDIQQSLFLITGDKEPGCHIVMEGVTEPVIFSIENDLCKPVPLNDLLTDLSFLFICELSGIELITECT